MYDNIFDLDPDLEVVQHVSLDDEPYQFDERIIAKDRRTGEYFTARDSGCSCPIPFEDFQSRDDLVGVRFSTYTRSLDRWDAQERRRKRVDPKSRMRPIHTVRYGDTTYAYEVIRCSWDCLINEAKAVLAASKGTATDRFYGTPPDESTIAQYIEWLHARRIEGYKVAGRPVPQRLRSPGRSVLS